MAMNTYVCLSRAPSPGQHHSTHLPHVAHHISMLRHLPPPALQHLPQHLPWAPMFLLNPPWHLPPSQHPTLRHASSPFAVHHIPPHHPTAPVSSLHCHPSSPRHPTVLPHRTRSASISTRKGRCRRPPYITVFRRLPWQVLAISVGKAGIKHLSPLGCISLERSFLDKGRCSRVRGTYPHPTLPLHNHGRGQSGALCTRISSSLFSSVHS